MTLLIFLVVLSILIFVHELGHFWMARRSGIKVEEFGFGFPPKIWSKKFGETIYSINALPVGGFVKLYGEDESVDKDIPHAFYHKGKLARARIVVAGVLMNFLLAVLCFGIISWVVGVPRQTEDVRIVGVAENSPAFEEGLRDGDVVISVDGQRVAKTDVFTNVVKNKGGQEIALKIKRDGVEIDTKVTPRASPPEGEGPLGVLVSSVETFYPPFWQRPFVSFWEGLKEAIFWAQTTVLAVVGTIAQLTRGTPPEGIAGPVGIFQITGVVARQGILPLLSFVGILSINLAVLNILPFPALDGGRLLFIIVETIFGRRVLPKFERMAHTIGMIVLLILILLVTLSDVRRLLSGGFDFLQNPQ
ncbi:MAG: RIP metalloprotease RseP [bacterium]|nr:RIP metalloprotease RseP [bacterium]